MSPERLFTAVELEHFFRTVDRHLKESLEIVLIGGSAAALAYQVRTGTTDVDLFESRTEALDAAFVQARLETGLAIPVSQPAEADPPYNCQSRLHRVLGDLQRLLVFVLEKHDLALSKMVRGHENDFAAIEELHQHNPLQEETLIARYLAEMGYVNKNPVSLDYNFLMLITRLFDELAHTRAERRIKEHRRARLELKR